MTLMRVSFLSLSTLLLAGTTTCATLIDWKDSIAGGETARPQAYNSDSYRGPASIQTGVALPKADDVSAGPNLSRDEFGNIINRYSDQASRGIRRSADPWDGTGPANEASLFNPYGQDSFFFSRNSSKKVGDMIVVKIEPDINEALNSRVAGLLGRTGLRQVVADEAGASVGSKVDAKVKEVTGGNVNLGKALGTEAQNRTVAALDAPVKYLELDEIPVRITEVAKGNIYKVDGVRKVLIKGAAYSVRMIGQLRDEDVGSASVVSSAKVFETKMELLK